MESPDQYLEHTELEEIKINPSPGCTLNLAVEEALNLATEVWCKVKFSHNGKEYTVDPESLEDQIMTED